MNRRELIVMVHGAWHWGGCFFKLANLISRMGRPVLTPDLAGHGYNATPLAAIRTMADYVAPVEAIIANAERPVILLGHSLGGATLNYLAERYPTQIAHLIYLTAVMPKNGASVVDYTIAQRAPSPLVTPLEDGSGLALAPDRAGLKAYFYADCSDRDVDVAIANVTEVNSLVPMAWKSDITPENFGRIPRLYIETLRDASLTIDMQRRFQADVPGADLVCMDTSHSPFFSRPEELAEVIASVL